MLCLSSVNSLTIALKYSFKTNWLGKSIAAFKAALVFMSLLLRLMLMLLIAMVFAMV